MKRISIVGLGGIGASYAAQAKDHGYEISFICDEARKKRYGDSKITVNGQPYRFAFISEADPKNGLDLIMIAVKYNQLEEAIALIKPFVTPHTIVLSLLNGINSEDIIRDRLSTDLVPLAFVNGTDGQRNGYDFRYSSKGKIVLGTQSGQSPSLATETAGILKLTGISYEVSDNIQYLMWWKFMVNIGINHTSAILGTPYKHFQIEGHAREIAKLGMMEVLPIARQCGVQLGEEDLEKAFALIESLSGENKISTLQDIEAKKSTEVEMLAGEMVRLGKKFNIPTPINELYYHAVRHIEENY